MKNQGFAAISFVLIISVVTLALSLTVSLLSLGEAGTALSLSKGEDTLAFVEGCTEDALLKSSASASYAGGPITRPEGTCQVTVSKVGNIWTLTVTTTDTKYKRTIETVITHTGAGITLTSWKEI